MTYHRPAGNRLGLRRSHRPAVRRSHPAGLHNHLVVHRSRRVLRHRSHLLLYQHLFMRNVGLVRHTALTSKSTSAASTAGALGCLVDTNGAAVKPESGQSYAEEVWRWNRLLNVIHVCDRSVGLGILGEAHKAKATAATSVAVLDDDLCLLVRVA